MRGRERVRDERDLCCSLLGNVSPGCGKNRCVGVMAELSVCSGHGL